MTKIDKLIENFYSIKSQDEIESIRNSGIFNRKFNLQKRKNEYAKNKNTIAKLQASFKPLVLKRNKIAQKNNFNNYFDFIADWDGIPATKLTNLESKITILSQKYNRFFINQNNLPDWINTKYNSLNLSYLTTQQTFEIPKEVINLLTPKYPKLKKYKKDINFTNKNYRYYYANYNFDQKSVNIIYDKTDNEVNSALLVAHELGHAVNYLTMMNKNINPDKRINYKDEKQAIKFELKFDTTLPKIVQKSSKDRILYHFAKTLFEKSIYQNPNSDYEEEFAKAINSVFPINDKTNPFYILDTSFINDPCYSTLYTVIYTELLSQ